MTIKMHVALLAAGLAWSAATAAQPAAQAGTSRVQVADLDLGTDAGIALLDRRIRGAVAAACGSASAVNVKGRNQVLRCRAETRAKATLQRDRAVAAARVAGPAQVASK